MEKNLVHNPPTVALEGRYWWLYWSNFIGSLPIQSNRINRKYIGFL